MGEDSDSATRPFSPQRRGMGVVLLGLNAVAAVAGATLWSLASAEARSEGEHWGLLRVLFIGSLLAPGMVALLVLTVVWAVRARGTSVATRLAVCGLIAAAIVSNVGAVGTALYDPVRHQEKFEAKSAFYASGLRQAVLDHDVEGARRILQEGKASASDRDYHGFDALMLAVKAGDRPMVEMLLANGADPTSRDFLDVTVLHVAAQRGDVAIARLLLDAGARVNDEDYHKKTPLLYAQDAGKQEMVALLTSKGGKDADEEERLLEAVRAGDLALVTRYLDKGLSVDTAVPNGMRLLDFAAKSGRVEMARLLISRGAVVTRADKNGRTALHWASGEGQAQMVAFLLGQGAAIDAMDYEGMTPLHTAIYWAQWHEPQSLETVRILVKSGANVNAKGASGPTPLRHAAEYGTDSIRAFLREHGAKE